MRAAIIDTETNGTSNDHQAIEVAVVLYDTVHAAPVATFATLISATSNDAAHINKIPSALLDDVMDKRSAWARVEELIQCADVIVAHNAPFDRRFTPEHIAVLRPWICSQRDIAWPESGGDQKLMTVAIAHGVPVISAHRALTDVDILVRLFQRLAEKGHDVAEMLREAMIEKPLFEALVSFEEKDLAKSEGFSWNKPAKRWEKKMRPEVAAKLKFKTRRIEIAPTRESLSSSTKAKAARS